MNQIQFNSIAPRTREERLSMKDKEKIEQNRLRERVGGFQKYVDSAQINNPDPISTYHVTEAQRFDKDFANIDRSVRAQQFDKNQSKISNLRQERLHREQNKWNNHEYKEQLQENRLKIKTDVYQAAKKNMGGSAYNIVNLDYDRNKEGEKLKIVDNDARVRAMMRSKNLDNKNNSGFNILTGENRHQITVPAHERYNPIKSAAGQMVLGSSHSQRQIAMLPPPSQQSQRSVYSRAGTGILPGMN